jgi:hypothetical protein
MKKVNWTSVQASQNGGKKLPAGGYVLIITNVKDVEDKEYLEVEWDINEGEYKGHFSDEWGRTNTFAHSFKVSYKDSAAGLFKQFLSCLEKSNPSFNIEQWQAQSNPLAFVGKIIGASWGTEKYTNQNGEDRERMTFPLYWSADDIRTGNFEVPKDKDNRKHTSTPAPAPAVTEYDEDIPFL